MCGRYSFAYDDWNDVIRVFQLTENLSLLPKRYNVAPGQMIPAIIANDLERRIGLLRWGLIPHFASDDNSGNKMINARSETLLERKSFRQLLTRKRCLIPTDGFFEWKKAGSLKQPMRIALKNRKLFSIAGLYDSWIAKDGSKISTCTIITTTPNALVGTIHNRMPVILSQSEESLWLNKNETDPAQLLSILRPYPAGDMYAYPVSTLVNNVRNDVPECIARIGE